jgi:hypothetical protein
LRYAVYVAGALLAFFVAVGLGAAAALVAGWQSERTQAGYGGPAEFEVTASSSASNSASDSAPAFEGTMPEGTVPEQSTAAGDVPPDESGAEETVFVHRATDENSRGDYTYLSDPAIDGDPDALVMVAGSANREGGDRGATYGHNIGVWYEPGAQKWAIFNQDLAAVPAGATFRVVLPPASESFVHRARLDNNVGETTYLDDPLTNGKADALVSVTQNWNPGGGGGVYNDHPVGVLYDEDVQKWSVYNRDGASMPDGAAFNVAVSDSDQSAR